MEILLNGQPESVEDNITVAVLLEQILPGGGRVAVEVNEEIVPRAKHPEHALNPGDKVEVVQAIGGG